MISRELLCQYVLKEKRAEPPGLALSCPLHSKNKSVCLYSTSLRSVVRLAWGFLIYHSMESAK